MWTAFALGIFIGTFIGIIITGLCVEAKDSQRESDLSHLCTSQTKQGA